jgi:biofilm PGA synthesis N-glycosyltransferase PgaC
MGLIEVIFWSLLGLVLYTYLGYGILLGILSLFKRPTPLPLPSSETELPSLTVLIAAYNEKRFIREKLENSLALDYPPHKREIWVVTDGSDDGTPELVQEFSEVRLHHQPERKGKLAAVDRIMPQINSDIVVFTDANTHLNRPALLELVRHFQDENVGVVAGEKRIRVRTGSSSTEAGEGLYWKYESQLKRWDAKMSSVLGAAGELFAIRRKLYQTVAPDTIVEDFVLSMEIVRNGYRGAYAPEAYAQESGSATLGEEWKRKVRIAAGGAQAFLRLGGLLNPFRHGVLSWQYFSHRVLRWTLAPFSLPFILLLNMYLAWAAGGIFAIFLVLQGLIYFLGAWELLRQLKGEAKGPGFVAFYFLTMNAAIWVGWWRFLRGRQSVLWEKAERAK